MSKLPSEELLDPDVVSNIPYGDEFAQELDKPCGYGEDLACPELDDMDTECDFIPEDEIEIEDAETPDTEDDYSLPAVNEEELSDG